MSANKPGTDTAGASDAVEAFLRGVKPMIIGGERTVGSGGTLKSENPAKESDLAEVAAAGRSEVDAAVAAAEAALPAWAATPPVARARLMLDLADAIDAEANFLARLETLDGGKPIQITSTLDIPFAAEIFRYNAGWCGRLGGKTVTPYMQDKPFHAFTVREPVGVTVGIVPWNFPLIQVAVKLSSALAAGCPMIIKPAEQTPLSAIRLAELAMEVGFPPGVIQVLNGRGIETGKSLVAHSGVSKISFTGSTATGRSLVHAAAMDFKRLTLELGGKSPNIIFDDADLELAIPGAIQACFLNTGQVCHAGTRLYVQQGIFDRVTAAIVKEVELLRVGDPLDPSTFLGPVVSSDQLEKILGYVDDAREDGIEVVTGGKRLDRKGYFIPPTILLNPDPAHHVVREEIFGPVLCIIPFDDEEDLIHAANGVGYGLAAGIWTRSLDRAHRAARSVKAGSVWINAYHVADPALPFGGFKESGWGRELGEAGITAFTEAKSVAISISP